MALAFDNFTILWTKDRPILKLGPKEQNWGPKRPKRRFVSINPKSALVASTANCRALVLMVMVMMTTMVIMMAMTMMTMVMMMTLSRPLTPGRWWRSHCERGREDTSGGIFCQQQLLPTSRQYILIWSCEFSTHKKSSGVDVTKSVRQSRLEALFTSMAWFGQRWRDQYGLSNWHWFGLDLT